MKRLLIIGGLVVVVLAVAVYRAKLGAEETEGKNSDLHAEARKLTEEIAVLKAEEAYLSRPERIGPIARERLGLQPARPDQYTATEALSRRLGEERLTLPDQPAPAKSAPKPTAKPAAQPVSEAPT